jgi:hypothetical protein
MRLEEVDVVSVTETTNAAPSTRRSVSPALLGNALPLIGLALAVIVNAAWIGLLGYFVFRLV